MTIPYALLVLLVTMFNVSTITFLYELTIELFTTHNSI